MNHNTVKLVVEGNIKFYGIFADTFDADVDLALDNMDILTGVEGYYVGKRSVLEVLEINTRQKRVRAKNIVHFTQFLAFGSNYFF